MTGAATDRLLLRMRCPDQPGILAGVTPFLTGAGCDIRESDIFGDPESNTFFIRMVLSSTKHDADSLKKEFVEIGDELSDDWSIENLDRPMRVLLAVSKFEHCLSDILYKCSIGALPIEIVGVVSNHEKARRLVDTYDLPFHHLPITRETKPQQEAAFLEVISQYGTDLVVLARYMQILSDEMSKALSGRCINIHHSFLPSFKGAKPYHQAHSRGVKLIGATAHYVTADLDEGPIIEQDVRRVNHHCAPSELVELGREVEASVLSRAIKWHAEGRVFLNGSKTIVF